MIRSPSRALLLAAALLALAGCEDEDDPAASVDLDAPVVVQALETARAEGWEARYDDLYPTDAVSEGVAVFVVYGLSLALPIFIALLLLVRALRAWTRVRAASSDAKGARSAEALTLGPTMLHGEVVEVDEPGPAVALEVRQAGVERRGKKSVKTIWTEVDRTLDVQPFVIALANGQRVRVEPVSTATELVDDMSPGAMVADSERVRRAELTVGETVYASGVLERAVDPTSGYRGEGSLRVLRPPPSAPMRLSTHPLGATHSWQMWRALRWAALALGVAALGAGWLHRPYLVARHAGFSTGTAVVVGKSTEEGDENDTFYLVSVVVAEMDGVFREALDEPVWRSVEIGDRMPVQYHPDYPEYGQIGQRAAMYSGKIVLEVLLLLGFFVVLFLFWRSGTPWYAQARVVDEQSGAMPKLAPESEA